MRLSVEETLRNLKQVEEKHKIRFTPTGEVNISEMARNCIDTIEALQQENEQLQAQNGAMRETLKQVQHDIDGAECRDDLDGIKGYIDEALSDTPADYHNPADVEALRKAREAIKAAWSDGSVNVAMYKASEALAAIDKVIGGGINGWY